MTKPQQKPRSMLDDLLDLLDAIGKLLKPSNPAPARVPVRNDNNKRYKQR
jgi:hypothetical protein